MIKGKKRKWLEHREPDANTTGWSVFVLHDSDVTVENEMVEVIAGDTATIGSVLDAYSGNLLVKSRSLRTVGSNVFIVLAVSDAAAATLLGLSTATARVSANSIAVDSISMTFWRSGLIGYGYLTITQTTTSVQVTKRRHLFSFIDVNSGDSLQHAATEDTDLLVLRV